MNNEQNYNPNSAKHNDPWESNLDNEEWDEHQWKNKNVPRHREGYFWGDKEIFNETCNFLHKLDELPKDASEGFGHTFVEKIIPAFFNQDAFGVLKRSKMTENGKLTDAFSYLQAYIEGKD